MHKNIFKKYFLLTINNKTEQKYRFLLNIRYLLESVF